MLRNVFLLEELSCKLCNYTIVWQLLSKHLHEAIFTTRVQCKLNSSKSRSQVLLPVKKKKRSLRFHFFLPSLDCARLGWKVSTETVSPWERCGCMIVVHSVHSRAFSVRSPSATAVSRSWSYQSFFFVLFFLATSSHYLCLCQQHFAV